MCVKVVRTTLWTPLKKIEKVYGSFISSDVLNGLCTDISSRNRRGKSDPHPNVLPVIDVSKTTFPLCIMTPWMQNGNITQYTRMNPGANWLMLVCARRPSRSMMSH